MKIGISSVDDYISGLKYFLQLADDIINGLAGRNHQKNLARARKRGGEFSIRKSPGKGLACTFTGEKLLRYLGDIVVNSYFESLGSHVQGKAFAHYSEAHKAYVA